jgi:hypothetical protein
MKSFLIALLIILQALECHAGDAPKYLYIRADIQTEALAEESIALLHCLNEKYSINWELSEDSTRFPRLTIISIDSHLKASLQRSFAEKADTLSLTLPLNAAALCDWTAARFASQPNPDYESSNAMLMDTSIGTEKTFLQKNWPWLAVIGAGLLVAGVKYAQSHRKVTIVETD